MNLRAFKNTTRGLWVGRGLVAVGLVAMSVCVYFNARHGWNLGTIWPDKVALSTMHGLIDIATALLVSAGAILFAWYMRKMGFAACAFALLLTCFSVLSVSGFMSGRIAALESQKATLTVLEKHAKWAGGTTYREAGRVERRSLRTEMRDNLKEMVRVASLIPDSHAMAIASMLGWTVEAVQRTLVLISSGMAQALKYVCLLVGFFLLSNRDERGAQAEPANQQNSGGSGGSGGGEPRKPKQVYPEPKPEPAKVRAEPSKQRSVFYVPSTGAPERNLSAYDIASEVAQANPHLSTRAMVATAQRRFSQSTASRAKRDVLRGKADRIIRKMGNGRGFHSPAYN